MGRRKITIKQISDPKLRHITFNKRKNGLIKKAAELSVLCNVNMLLVFEDGEGNLIQFSKNKVANVTEFYGECQYTNLLDFTANDYPCFFKVNHYKKHKQKGLEDYGDEDDDDLEYQDEMEEKSPLYEQESRLYNKASLPISKHLKEEEVHNGHMIYQSASDRSENDMPDTLNNYNDAQIKKAQLSQIKNQGVIKPNVNIPKIDDKQRLYSNPAEANLNMMNNQDPSQNQKDQFQNFKGQLDNYQNAYGNFDSSFKPANQLNNQQMPFRYFPTEANKNPNINLQNMNNPGFNQASKLPNNLPNMPNMPFMNNAITSINNINNINANTSNITPTNPNTLPTNNQAFKPVQNNFTNNAAAQALAGFAANMNMNNIQGMGGMGNMAANMANIANMGNIKNTDTLNAMLKGLPSLGFAIGGANPFMAKAGAKPEVDDKIAGLDKANMMKYFTNTAPAAGGSYSMPKMYNFHASEGDKVNVNVNVNDAGNFYQMRKTEIDGNNYDLGQDFDEAAQFARGDYRFDNTLPSNLPSAYFGSKKSNFDGFFGANFEEKFSELADSKKKAK